MSPDGGYTGAFFGRLQTQGTLGSITWHGLLDTLSVAGLLVLLMLRHEVLAAHRGECLTPAGGGARVLGIGSCWRDVGNASASPWQPLVILYHGDAPRADNGAPRRHLQEGGGTSMLP